MKKTILWSALFVLSMLCFRCTQDVNESLDTKATIVQRIYEQSDKISINGSEKAIIALDDYCQAIDCETYFQGYEDKFILYPKIDLFMRNIGNYTQIESMTNSNATIYKVGVGGKKERVEIGL